MPLNDDMPPDQEDTKEDNKSKKPYSFGEYKGHKLLVFGEETQYPFQFGAGKAKMLLEAIDAMGVAGFEKLLRDFVAEQEKNK